MDDPDPGGAGPFGTCCTASTIEVAFAESVIDECGRCARGSDEVPDAELTERSVVRFACERRQTLVLADLTGAALNSVCWRHCTGGHGGEGWTELGCWSSLEVPGRAH